MKVAIENIEAMQRYAPYRKEMLSADELKSLHAPNTPVVVFHTLLHWAAIVSAWSIAAIWTSWWGLAFATVIIGTQYYGLLIVAHDGLHRRLSNSRAFNDFWCDVMILGAIGANTRLNRTNHIRHHAHTCEAEDPDRFKYTHAGKESQLSFMLFLTGLTSVFRVVANIFIRDERQHLTDESKTVVRERYTARDIGIIVVWQVMLIGGLSAAFGWWGYPMMWLLPVYLFAYRADLTRVFCEHSILGADDDADRSLRLITYASNPLERLFFAPHGMNFHAVHHLWPSVPYVNLRRADELMRRSPHASKVLIDRRSYVAYIFSYLFAQSRPVVNE